MYARGMSVREIQGHLRELYGIEISPELVSTVTDAVLDEVAKWQTRPLEAALCDRVLRCAAGEDPRRGDGAEQSRLPGDRGALPEGTKDVLGIWIEQTEGAKFWLRVMTELKNRGVADILIAVVDGLKGFPEAINAVFPQAQVQTCIVHLIRYSMQFASWKERKAVAGGVEADLSRRDR